MTVFNTEMHLLTFIFIVLEVFMFSHQVVFYFLKPNEKRRKYYLILLLLLIVYNVFGGLFPDEDLKIPIELQNILAYGGGFTIGAYFPYYFYKAFNITYLEFQAKYGVLIFLIAPFIIFFCILYPLGLELIWVKYIGLVIPFFYAVYMLYTILDAIRYKLKEKKISVDIFLSYYAVCPWAIMPLLAYLQVGQLIQVLLTNGGFIIITVLYFRDIIKESRDELFKLDMLQKNNDLEVFTFNCSRMGLTKREIEICQKVKIGFIYKEIAETLDISERTVNKHMQNIFNKTDSRNKIDLLNKTSL